MAGVYWKICDLISIAIGYCEAQWSIWMVHWDWVLTMGLALRRPVLLRLSHHEPRMRQARYARNSWRLRCLHLKMLLDPGSTVERFHGRPVLVVGLDRVGRDGPIGIVLVLPEVLVLRGVNGRRTEDSGYHVVMILYLIVRK